MSRKPIRIRPVDRHAPAWAVIGLRQIVTLLHAVGALPRATTAASSHTVLLMANDTPPDKALPRKRLGSFVFLLLAVALAGSLAGGIPKSLPGVALGSPALLYAERTVAFFAALLLALVVLVRAFQGRLPSELSGRGVKYAEREATEEIRDTTATALEGLEVAYRELATRVEALEEAPLEDDEAHAPEEGERE